MVTNENTKSPAGAKALLAGIDARLEEIDAQGAQLMEEFTRHDAALRGLLKRMNALRKEAQDLDALKRRYRGRPARAEATEGNDDRPGSTAVILGLLQAAPNHQLPVDEVVQRVEAAIKAGSVRTATTDPRKLASSVVGNLVRQGRLVRQVHRDGEVVILAENGK